MWKCRQVKAKRSRIFSRYNQSKIANTRFSFNANFECNQIFVAFRNWQNGANFALEPKISLWCSSNELIDEFLMTASKEQSEFGNTNCSLKSIFQMWLWFFQALRFFNNKEMLRFNYLMARDETQINDNHKPVFLIF